MRITPLTAIVAASLGLAALLVLHPFSDPTAPTATDRAIAMGLLIDTPASASTVDEALRIAEQLRRHYGLASGNLHADRVAAALRARDEMLMRLDFTAAEVRASAEALGYSLDPARCANTCANVARLARIELEKGALRKFAAGVTPQAGG